MTQSDENTLRKPQPTSGKGSSVPLDELDWKILSELALDARNAFQGIAEKLKVDEKTVRNRIARLRSSNTVQFLTLLDANQSEQCLVMLAGVNVSPEARTSGDRFADELSNIPAVSWCGRVMGRFDYMLEAVFPSLAKLREFETTILPSWPGVINAETFFVVSHHGKRKVPIFPLASS